MAECREPPAGLIDFASVLTIIGSKIRLNGMRGQKTRYSSFFLLAMFLLLFSPAGLSKTKRYNGQTLTPETILNNLESGTFTGQKIDFVFSNTSVIEMLAYLEQISGIEFSVDPRIQKHATYHLIDVPWDQALASVLQDNDLHIDSLPNRLKIYQGGKFEVVFTDREKARFIIFVYRHFHKIILGLLFLAAMVLGFRIWRRSRGTKKLRSKDLLDPVRADEVKKRLMFLLEVEKIFRDENLTLLSLAEELSITPHQLSWFINDRMNQTFSTLINRYRIEDVKERLGDVKNTHLTIMQIALDAGFSTKTAFNRAFKKFTGHTPSQYRKDNHR